MDFVLADEITHVRMGSKWLTKLTEGDPERRRRAIEFQETIDERFNLGGVRQDGEHDAVLISIATEARQLGGFTDEEIERLIKTTQRSPGLLRPDVSAGRRSTRSRSRPPRPPLPLRRRAHDARARRVARLSRPRSPPSSSWAGTSGTMPSTPTRSAAGCPSCAPMPRNPSPPGEGFIAFMDALESAETPELTVERLVGVYRVLKPHLLAAYERDLASANAVYEPPTRRILARCAEDERAPHRGGRARARAPRDDARGPGPRHRVGGASSAGCSPPPAASTGEGLPAPIPPPVSPEGVTEAEEFIRLETRPARWPLPDDLRAAAAGLGDALVARDAVGVRRWLADDSVWSEAADSMLAAARFNGHEIVATTRIGQHLLLKLRLDGPEGSVTLAARWAPGPEGWRAQALDVAHVRAARSA